MSNLSDTVVGFQSAIDNARAAGEASIKRVVHPDAEDILLLLQRDKPNVDMAIKLAQRIFTNTK